MSKDETTADGADVAPANRWASVAGAGGGRDYAARFAALAAAGNDMHGEASFCAQLLPPGGTVLDAGCGTGRVAIRLAELGYRCVGVDADASMIEVAREESIAVQWALGDLAALDLVAQAAGPFDLIVAAGNVMPLLAPGTEPGVIAGLSGRLCADGRLVAGFGLDAEHLPLDKAPFGLTEYDAWCAEADLELLDRFSTWSGERATTSAYAVSIHARRPI